MKHVSANHEFRVSKAALCAVALLGVVACASEEGGDDAAAGSGVVTDDGSAAGTTGTGGGAADNGAATTGSTGNGAAAGTTGANGSSAAGDPSAANSAGPGDVSTNGSGSTGGSGDPGGAGGSGGGSDDSGGADDNSTDDVSAGGMGGAGGNADDADDGSTDDAAAADDGAADDSAGGDDDGSSVIATDDTVTRSESTFTFQHFPVETNADDVWSGGESPAAQATSTTYDTIVLENGYLRVTLLPSYGGRVLSIVHKPTDRELLYQNPTGTPYLMYQDIFYYDYLVIMGGIFPSFPEPEHGRYWNQPYDVEIVSETDEAITVRMSRLDDRGIAEGVPAAYTVGRTDVLVEVEVTLRAGSAALELDTTLTNTLDTPVGEFEFWTVTTLAPGSVPGQTEIPLNTRIMADMERVHLLESSWAWFGDAEERVSDEVFTWDNLSYFENWVDQGTGFASPSYSANWSGLINYESDMGILRVSDNVETPGLKLWTFGNVSLNVDISDADEWLRPTIEMWHGVTPEFWDRASLAGGEVRSWSESYFATLGMREITAASEYGALYLSRADAGEATTLSADATLTLPEQTVTAILRLDGNVIAEQDVVVADADVTNVSVTVPSSDVTAGAVFEVEFTQGDVSLLSGQTTL